MLFTQSLLVINLNRFFLWYLVQFFDFKFDDKQNILYHHPYLQQISIIILIFDRKNGPFSIVTFQSAQNTKLKLAFLYGSIKNWYKDYLCSNYDKILSTNWKIITLRFSSRLYTFSWSYHIARISIDCENIQAIYGCC